jgi:hypothetical protein
LVVPVSKKDWLKQAALSLSLAQLSFTYVFVEVLGLASDPNARYYETSPPSYSIVYALLLDIVLLAGFLFLCFRAREAKAKWMRAGASAILAFFTLFAAIQCFRRIFQSVVQQVGMQTCIVASVGIGLAAAIFLVVKPGAAIHAVRVLLLIMSPLFVIGVTSVIVSFHSAHAEAYDRGHAAGMLPSSVHQRRVIWVIFDELDQYLLFQVKPQRVHLSAFETLRARSLYATHVTSPNPNTMPSLLSLVSGRVVAGNVGDAKSLRVQFQGCSTLKRFDTYPNIFARARAAGFNTGLSGWHHPYCRLMGDDLSACAWGPGTQPFMIADRALEPRSFAAKALYLAQWEAETFPYRSKFGMIAEPGGMPEMRRDTIETFQYVMTHAEEMVRDSRLNLVLVHLPIPHPPGIWDATRHDFTTGPSNYIDNLELADESLRRLERALQASGTAEYSTLLVSSDHPYRTLAWQTAALMKSTEMQKITQMREHGLIPFLLQLPGQRSSLAYTKSFNSIVSGDLLLAILNMRVSTPEEAAQWLDEHAAAGVDDPASCK